MKNKLIGILCLLVSLSFLSSTIDLDNLLNYQNQAIPDYITRDNTIDNEITDAGATLGRVLFYDKKLSLNNTIACSSCHLQAFAFGDTAQVSRGFAGATTERHAMRLVNARFGSEHRFFWDERAPNLEAQSSQPIQDHIEMGFSGSNGQPDIDSLFSKLENIDYYNDLFELVFGDSEVTEARIQLSLAQFIRSIQSFDATFDLGRAQVENNMQPFPNFSPEENMGKMLFITPPEFNLDGIRIGGGAGCQQCHRAPEFDIIPFSRNNGVIGSTNEAGIDLTNTRSPSLRDLVNPAGQLNGGMMHNGSFTSLEQVVEHYNAIPSNPLNTELDPRLRPGNSTQNLDLSEDEKAHLVAFLRTLTGSDVYTNEKWSDPFDENGELTLVGGPIVSTEHPLAFRSIDVFPNPSSDYVILRGSKRGMQLKIFNQVGQSVFSQAVRVDDEQISVAALQAGLYFVVLQDATNPTLGQSIPLVLIK